MMKKDRGYSDASLKQVIREAGGKQKLITLKTAERIADALFDADERLEQKARDKGYSEWGLIDGTVVYDYAHAIATA